MPRLRWIMMLWGQSATLVISGILELRLGLGLGLGFQQDTIFLGYVG